MQVQRVDWSVVWVAAEGLDAGPVDSSGKLLQRAAQGETVDD